MELLRDFLRKKKVIANEVAKKLPKQQTISIFDSEDDIYDVYHEAEGHPRIEKADWLIRAVKNRPLLDTKGKREKILGQSGGFINRKNDGDPRPIVIWIGLQRLKGFFLAGQVFLNIQPELTYG